MVSIVFVMGELAPPMKEEQHKKGLDKKSRPVVRERWEQLQVLLSPMNLAILKGDKDYIKKHDAKLHKELSSLTALKKKQDEITKDITDAFVTNGSKTLKILEDLSKTKEGRKQVDMLKASFSEALETKPLKSAMKTVIESQVGNSNVSVFKNLDRLRLIAHFTLPFDRIEQNPVPVTDTITQNLTSYYQKDANGNEMMVQQDSQFTNPLEDTPVSVNDSSKVAEPLTNTNRMPLDRYPIVIINQEWVVMDMMFYNYEDGCIYDRDGKAHGEGADYDKGIDVRYIQLAKEVLTILNTKLTTLKSSYIMGGTMKKTKKIKFEKMLEIYDKTHIICTWENVKEWRKELEANGWTDEEFDTELNKRIMEKRIA